MKYKLLFLIIILPTILLAQEPLHYWKKTTEFMEEQTNQSFQLVQQLLKENPPSLNINTNRKSALMHLDWIFHDPRLDTSIYTTLFLENQLKLIAKDLKNEIKKGVKIYKLYNHGFIVKSPTVTFAFDITRAGQGKKSPLISENTMNSIVEQCDVLFISHIHGDHADEKVRDLFLKNNKEIIATTGMWENIDNRIQHFRSEEILTKKIKLLTGKELDLMIMPGHQDKVPNNVYLVTTPEKITIAHTGDQWNKEKDEWISTVKNHKKIDALLVHCWSMPLEKTIEGFDPKIVITGHENELVHSIDHREPYWLNYRRMKNVNKPIVYMTWGEYYHYKK